MPETPETSGKPGAEEIQIAADVLSQLTPGKLPLRIFLEVARLTVTPIIEVVPVRKRENGAVEVLLLRREPDDPNWPNMLHTPGTVIRASDTDEGYKDAFSRIEKELNGTQIGEPSFVECLLHKVKRGMESSQIYVAEVIGKATTGEWHLLDNLPSDIVDTQIGFIRSAAAFYQESRSK